MIDASINPAQCIADTQRWLEQAVIGLNLCPFAKAVHVKDQIHYAVSLATEPGDLMEDLVRELQLLGSQAHPDSETTLLVAPCCLADFLEFNYFLGLAQRTLKARKWVGVIQIASFHPQYQFADSLPEDMGNFTNRAPYPTLHLLREDRMAQALASFTEPQSIYQANLQTLNALGLAGWEALRVGAGCTRP
jgi:uncharacterized protein